MRIGFACLWDRHAPATWSRTPWELRAAMRAHADVVDLGIHLPIAVRRTLQLAHLAYRDGELVSLWRQGRITDRYCVNQLRRTSATCDKVLLIQDLATVDRPFYVYQDMSFDALLSLMEQGHDTFRILTRDSLQRRRERQLKIYERATGVIAMSQWLADSLVKDSGVPEHKVHVLHPGTTAVSTEPLPLREGPRTKLLFVGRTFHSKGGEVALAALALLRRDMDITLTIVGPPTWPLDGEPPEGVNFLGARPAAEVAGLYDTHDLFVLPTRIEGFGIVFAEALARGLPCIGRNGFAMPEIIQAPRYGELLDSDDPYELAAKIAKALADDDLYARCHADAGAIADYYSWDRAARDAVRIMTD